MRRARAAVAGGAALLALAAAAVAGAAVLDHERARADYAAEAARLERGDPAYDPAASDAFYARAVEASERARPIGWLAAALLLAAALCSPFPADDARAEPSHESRADRRAALAAWIDAAAIGLAVGVALALPSWVGAAHGALGAVAQPLALGVCSALYLRALARGRPPGARLLAISYRDGLGRPPGLGRAVASLALLPFGLLLTPWTALRGRPPLHLWSSGLSAHPR